MAISTAFTDEIALDVAQNRGRDTLHTAQVERADCFDSASEDVGHEVLMHTHATRTRSVEDGFETGPKG